MYLSHVRRASLCIGSAKCAPLLTKVGASQDARSEAIGGYPLPTVRPLGDVCTWGILESVTKCANVLELSAMKWFQCVACHVKKPKPSFANENSELVCSSCRSFARDAQRQTLKRDAPDPLEVVRRRLIDGYGGACTCCGERELAFLTLEHVLGNGAAHRKRTKCTRAMYLEVIEAGFPSDFTVLCMNCNWAGRGGALCPHKRARGWGSMGKRPGKSTNAKLSVRKGKGNSWQRSNPLFGNNRR